MRTLPVQDRWVSKTKCGLTATLTLDFKQPFGVFRLSEKTISILTPCYNEEGNVLHLYNQVREVMAGIGKYGYEHVFIDNSSRDNTVAILKSIAAEDKNVKIIIALVYLVLKLLLWSTFSFGLAPMLIGVFFISSLQLMFLGVMGEYIGAIYTQIQKRPYAVELDRINFEYPPSFPKSSGLSGPLAASNYSNDAGGVQHQSPR